MLGLGLGLGLQQDPSLSLINGLQAYLPFSCAGCKKSRALLRIDVPVAVRLALFLILILNCMWIEAIFTGHNEVEDDCFVVICPDAMWVLRWFFATVFANILSGPANRLV